MGKDRRSKVNALVVLGAAGLGAFALSTAAVTAAGPAVASSSAASPYPFTNLSLTGGVRPSAANAFSLDFTTTFTLSPDSPGITAPNPDIAAATQTPPLANVTLEDSVSYPVPSGGSEQSVGPVGLPFTTQTLKLSVQLSGNCFVKQLNAKSQVMYVLQGSPSACAAATLTLSDNSYDVSSLFDSVAATFTQTWPQTWKGVISANFENPGYAFPVSSLGGGGGTSLRIGPNGGDASTRAAGFAGGPDLVGPPNNKDQCKGVGWSVFNNPSFKDQGDCVSYVTSGGKYLTAG